MLNIDKIYERGNMTDNQSEYDELTSAEQVEYDAFVDELDQHKMAINQSIDHLVNDDIRPSAFAAGLIYNAITILISYGNVPDGFRSFTLTNPEVVAELMDSSLILAMQGLRRAIDEFNRRN